MYFFFLIVWFQKLKLLFSLSNFTKSSHKERGFLSKLLILVATATTTTRVKQVWKIDRPSFYHQLNKAGVGKTAGMFSVVQKNSSSSVTRNLQSFQWTKKDQHHVFWPIWNQAGFLTNPDDWPNILLSLFWPTQIFFIFRSTRYSLMESSLHELSVVSGKK